MVWTFEKGDIMKNAEKVIDTINSYVKDNGTGKIISREEFYDILLAKYPEINRASVYPSDFCYNVYNDGLRDLDDGERCLECVDKGYFKILGTNYKYTGDVYHYIFRKNQEIVGHWENGQYHFNNTSKNDTQDITCGYIYRIYNAISNRDFSIGYTEDYDKFQSDFISGKLHSRGLDNYKYRDSLKIELLEQTDNIPKSMAFYKWPQLNRLTYSENMFKHSLEPKFTKTVNHVVDELINMFASNEYSFKLNLNTEGFIEADVFNKDKQTEHYTFRKNGKPYSREIL